MGFRHPGIPNDPEAAASYLKLHGSAGYERIVATLADPGDDPYEALRLLKLMPRIDTPELRQKLVEGLPRQVEDICFISLALCLMSDERGLPRIIEMLKTARADKATICSSNLFISESGRMNPLVKIWGCDSDLLFTVSVVESTLSHTFAGDDLEQKRDSILAWWAENSDGIMQDWEVGFLNSDDPANRARAFGFLITRTHGKPELVQRLAQSLIAETDPSLRAHMATKLFQTGVAESLPYFDELVRSAKTPEEISQILATVRHFVNVPSRFIEIDTWRDGRDDNATFAFLLEWWEANYQFLEFNEHQWAPTKIEIP